MPSPVFAEIRETRRGVVADQVGYLGGTCRRGRA